MGQKWKYCPKGGNLETRKHKILNHIRTNIPKDKKVVLLTITDPNTGEIFEENIPVIKSDVIEPYQGESKLALAPFLRLSLNKCLDEEYLCYFTQAEKGSIYDIIRKIDAMGRIKYGDNFQQYCRSVEDLALVLGVNYETMRKRFIPKLKKHDIIRTIEISRGEHDNIKYIVFNPALAMNGVYWDRWAVIIWEDVIRKHKLLTENQIKKILHNKYTQQENVNYKIK